MSTFSDGRDLCCNNCAHKIDKGIMSSPDVSHISGGMGAHLQHCVNNNSLNENFLSQQTEKVQSSNFSQFVEINLHADRPFKPPVSGNLAANSSILLEDQLRNQMIVTNLNEQIIEEWSKEKDKSRLTD